MSIYHYLPLLIVPFVLWLAIRGRMGAKAMVQKTEHMRAGAVARRLGLTLVEGDPNYHLAMSQAEATVGQGIAQQLKSSSPLATTLQDIRIKATGQPYNRPTQFSFDHKVELSAAIPVVGRTRTTTFGCSLMVSCQAQFPDFEVIGNLHSQQLEVNRAHAHLPPASFGNPMLDAQCKLFTQDPNFGPFLAQVISECAGQQAIHLYGSGGQLALGFEWWMMYGFADAAEQLQYLLESVACKLEGRPIGPRPQPLQV